MIEKRCKSKRKFHKKNNNNNKEKKFILIINLKKNRIRNFDKK